MMIMHCSSGYYDNLATTPKQEPDGGFPTIMKDARAVPERDTKQK
jgi:hypothetical protein